MDEATYLTRLDAGTLHTTLQKADEEGDLPTLLVEDSDVQIEMVINDTAIGAGMRALEAHAAQVLAYVDTVKKIALQRLEQR